jgi:bifunctional non-homologous end joining protein LigD
VTPTGKAGPLSARRSKRSAERTAEALGKKSRAWSKPEAGRAHSAESVLPDAACRAGEIRRELEALGAPKKALGADDVGLMQAETAEAAFSDPDWIFELKYDGYRLLASREDGPPRLRYRRGHDATVAFPEIARALLDLPGGRFVLDAEVVVSDAGGRPVFAELQQRALLSRQKDAERAALERPATCHVFDLLGFEDFDLRPLPLRERKRLLERLLPRSGPVRLSDHVVGHGVALYAEVLERGLEGIVAKRADSAYRAGRSPYWLKVRALKTADFVVVGFALPSGSRAGFAGLHLAEHTGGDLRYTGRVGSGFSDVELLRVRAELERARRETPPCTGAVPKGRDHVWVSPRLVCELRFVERTRDGLLRQPVFLRFRDDKAPEECLRQAASPALAPAAAAVSRSARALDKRLAFTNLDKPFWPEDGYTKGDLIEFYREVSPWLLPYLEDRLVVLTRYPDGIDGKSFFQKDTPSSMPGWLRTERKWSEHAEREIDYFVCDDVESLLYVVNLGSIPLHIGPSRVKSLDRPDWCILDLDPKGAPFEDVVTLARAIRKLCDELSLPSFPKTSGKSGLHVLIPLGRQCSFDESRGLGELLARVISEEHETIATTTRGLQKRRGRVYVDYLQNGPGRLLVSPFSVRPLRGAPVSTPLAWREVAPGLDPAAFTIRTVLPRLRRMKRDPLRPVLEESPDLTAALERLAARLEPRRRGRTS